MSDGQEQPATQSPAELAALLAERLAEAAPADVVRRLEPQATFSAELSWRQVSDESSR